MFERVLLSASIVLFVKVSVDPAKIYDCKSEISASTILIVFEAVLIVLFVKVSVVALPTKVSVDVGNVKVPEFEIDEITGVVKVLLVKVSVVSCKTIVPEAFGKLIVLSAVGSITPRTVSLASAFEPSNVNEFVTSIVDELTVVVVPLTVKLPVIVVLPVTVNPSSIVIKDESVDERVVPDIPIAEFCTALVPLPKRIAFDVKVTTPNPPCSTAINSPV